MKINASNIASAMKGKFEATSLDKKDIMLSEESMYGTSVNALVSSYEERAPEVIETLRTVFEFENEVLTEEALSSNGARAAVEAIAMTSGNNNAFSDVQAMIAGGKNHSAMSAFAYGPGGNLTGLSLTEEAFDPRRDDRMTVQNIMINFMAGSQEPGAELMFPTRVMAAGQTQLQSVVHVPFVRVQRRTIDGYAEERRPLMAAFTDHTLLDIPAIDLAPHRTTENAKSFSALVPAASRKVNGGTANVAPLKAGDRHNLRVLCDHAGSMGNIGLNHVTDMIAPGGRLTEIILGTKTGTPAEDVAIRVNIDNMPSTQFVNALSGNEFDQQVNFTMPNFPINKDTKTAGGAGIPALAALGDATVYVSFAVTGSLNLSTFEFGTSVSAVTVAAQGAVMKNGRAVPAEDQEYIDAVELVRETLGLFVESVEADLKLSNSNWARSNAIIDTEFKAEYYAPIIGQPIDVIAPTDKPDEIARKSKAVADTLVIRRTNRAYTTIINFFETLNSQKAAIEDGKDLMIGGIGRHLITKPFVETVEFDAYDYLSTRNNIEHTQNLQAAIVGMVRDVFYRAYREAGYGPIFQNVMPNAGGNPHVGMVTNDTLRRNLMPTDHQPVLGPNMGFTVEATNDDRFSTVVQENGEDVDVAIGYASFVIPGQPGDRTGLGFGSFDMLPTVVTQITRAEDNRQYSVYRASDIGIHKPVLPILVKFVVKNLKKAQTLAKSNRP